MHIIFFIFYGFYVFEKKGVTKGLISSCGGCILHLLAEFGLHAWAVILSGEETILFVRTIFFLLEKTQSCL